MLNSKDIKGKITIYKDSKGSECSPLASWKGTSVCSPGYFYAPYIGIHLAKQKMISEMHNPEFDPNKLNDDDKKLFNEIINEMGDKDATK